ncbi:MAG: sensor histidine kinase [Clostridiales bacterium]|nr:sensor histidine kinase [Candidatus Blautia equi]
MKDFFYKGSSLRKRLNFLLVICLVPLAVITLYLAYLAGHFSESYNDVVNTISTINKYNLEFKEDIDYILYVIVANSERADELVDVDRPHKLIKNARRDFTALRDEADSDTARNHADGILKGLDTLEQQILEIEDDSRISGNYDLNMERLDLNIRVMTELLQEQIQKYIYFETTNLEQIRERIQTEAYVTIGFAVALFVVIMVVAFIVSHRIVASITEPIEELCYAARTAGSGDFTVRTTSDSDDELDELNHTFNHMLERIGTLVENARIEQMNLRNMELKVLQEQINPHFLYNTLDAIIWLAEAGEKDQVVKMVSALSVFFRTSLGKGKDFVEVAAEQRHIESYLEIQQFRYRDILQYEIDIPAEVHLYQILKLTLQPLVENAIYHGIKNKRGGGHVRITGEKEGEDLIFRVWDNGPGIDEERLSHIRQFLAGEKKELEGTSSGFGLYNVNQRIQLNYGPSYGISIKSVYKEWTEVSVRIPARMNGEAEMKK